MSNACHWEWLTVEQVSAKRDEGKKATLGKLITSKGCLTTNETDAVLASGEEVEMNYL